MTRQGQGSRRGDQLSEIIETAADAIISVDSEFRITDLNPSALRLFGFTEDELLGQSINMLLPLNKREGHAALMQNFARSEDQARMMGERGPIEGLTKTGRYVPLDISILKHKRGQRRCFTAIVRDITEQVQAQQRLRDSERRFRAMFHGSYQFTGILDLEGKLTDMNDTARELVGPLPDDWDQEPVWSMPWWSDELSRARFKEAVKRARRGRFDRSIIKVTGADGRQLHVDLSVKPVFTRSGEIAFLVAEGRDVTELMNTYEALSKSEASLAQAQRMAGLGNWEWNIKTNKLSWSDEVYRIFGLAPHEFGASYDAFLARIHPDDRAIVEGAVNKALVDGDDYMVTHRIITPTGEEKIVQERGEVLLSSLGAPLTMTGTVQDITDTWKHEQELSMERDRAEAASRSKSQFLATMSHELRTPLNAIIGFSELIEKQVNGPAAMDDYMKYAQYARESGQHLLHIINDILDVSRADLGSITTDPKLFDPCSLILSVLNMVSTKAEEKTLDLSANCPEGQGEVFLDERLCRQVLLNLVSNAIKFSPAGGTIEIGFTISGPEATLYVRDNGPGISDEDLEHVFDPFFQVEGEYARRHEGVGLGLTIVKKFAEVQGGIVSVDSKIEEGTEVTVTFPAAAHSTSHAHELGCGCCGPEGRSRDDDGTA